jgi:hypothetical protein
MSYKLLIVVSGDSNDDSHSILNSHIVEFTDWTKAEKAFANVEEMGRTVDHLSYDVTRLY